MDEDELEVEHGPNGFGQRPDLEEMKLVSFAREVGEATRDWISRNPFAALGIAVGSGFVIGRVSRIWALRWRS